MLLVFPIIIQFLTVGPATCRPQGEEDEYRLEEQSDETSLIGVETEGIDMVHILVDVAWEDEHIEECKQRSDECLLFPKEQHAESKTYLYYA